MREEGAPLSLLAPSSGGLRRAWLIARRSRYFSHPLMTRSRWFTDPAVGPPVCTEVAPAIAGGGVVRSPQALRRGTSG
jgi:hypothetical protein